MTPAADLSKYLRPGQQLATAPAPPQQPIEGRPPYEAYCLSKEAKRHLEIRVKFPDPAECPLNSLITTIQSEWRMGLAVTITYGQFMVVHIRGERLQALFQAVKDWRVDWIAAYDPQEYAPPIDTNAPLIHSIEIITHRPEDPPPLHQRH